MASDETRARIINAAGPIFAEKGFKDATVREICDAAEVGLASVNYHFRDKQQLYVEVVDAAFDYLDENRPALREWADGTPVEVRLLEWIEHLAGKILASPRDSWQDRLLAREFQSPTPACAEILEKRVDREMAPLVSILEEALPPEASPAERDQFALSIIGQILIYDSHRDLVRMIRAEENEAQIFDATQVARQAVRVSLAALGLTPPLGRFWDKEQA